MSEEESKGSAPYLQKVGLVVLGAFIGVVPSYIASGRQAKLQMKQFILDRQVNTLKEYSTSLNQAGNKQLASLREMYDKLDLLESEAELTEDGNLPDDKAKLEELQRLIRNLSMSSDEFAGNLSTQRTMTYAVFGSKPDLTMPRLTLDDVKKWHERLTARLNEAGSDLERIRHLKQMMLDLENMVGYALTEHNKEIEKFALMIQEQQTSF